jgi:hypothetical protein
VRVVVAVIYKARVVVAVIYKVRVVVAVIYKARVVVAVIYKARVVVDIGSLVHMLLLKAPLPKAPLVVVVVVAAGNIGHLL